jgi:hypothetical protein
MAMTPIASCTHRLDPEALPVAMFAPDASAPGRSGHLCHQAESNPRAGNDATESCGFGDEGHG